jgi:hypothetical protein
MFKPAVDGGTSGIWHQKGRLKRSPFPFSRKVLQFIDLCINHVLIVDSDGVCDEILKTDVISGMKC